ncbi:MAG: TRAP transporter small permease [Candidatus Eiseniibacteriota bacterium]
MNDVVLGRLDRVTRWLQGLGVVALFAMMMATVTDVVLRSALKSPITGVYDLVESTLVLVVFLGTPQVFLRDEQITVDILDNVVSPRLLLWMKALAGVATLALLVLLAWTMVQPALETYRFGDRKPDLPIPIIWLWIAMFAGILSSIAVMVVIALKQVMRAIGGETGS